MDDMKHNLILTDVDGVLVYWEKAFHFWMMENNIKRIRDDVYDLDEKYDLSTEAANIYSKLFNESAALYKIPPYKDAIKYVKKLHEEFGFTFHCISAIPNTPDTFVARKTNLENLFGPTAIERVYLSGSSKNKPIYLEKYKDTGCFWIEDVAKNAEMGLNYGLQPILFNQPYNTDIVVSKDIIRVNNWKEVYDLLNDNV